MRFFRYSAAALLLLGTVFGFASCELFMTIFYGPLYGITIDVEDGGSVSTVPEAEKVEGLVHYFREGTAVTITATAEEGYRFSGWDGDAGRSYSSSLEFPALEHDISVSAGFSSVDLTWTFLVYLDGDNDLESAALDDFDEMEYGLYLAESGDPDVLDKLAVAVQIDRGGNSFRDFDGVWDGTRRYEIGTDAVLNDACNSRLMQDLGEVNMGAAETLKGFIEWGMATFPSDRYALVLWNHGGGARSLTDEAGTREVCIDDTDDYDALYIGEIADVLTADHSVDLLGFDACLMGTIETAYEYRPKTDGFGANYMVASPANEQGDGWEYDKIFARLAGSGSDEEGDLCYNASTLAADDFARLIVKEYYDAFASDYDDQTLSAYDLSYAQDVKNAVDALAGQLADQQSAVEAVRDDAVYYYDPTWAGDSVIWPYYELGSLGAVFSSEGLISTAAAEAVATALDSLILFSWAGGVYGGYDLIANGGANGVSIFFSLGGPQPGGGNDYSEYQWWYTDEDTTTLPGADSSFLYGKLDFCDSDETSPVDSWRELFDTWYLP